MKMKIAPLIVLAIAFVAAAMITPIHASFVSTVYAWTEKSSYLPGDTGVLHRTVRNQGTQSFTVKNITVNYPWKAFVVDHWDGNATYVLSPVAALASGQTYNTQYSFTVPTDGRANSNTFSVNGQNVVIGSQISISVGTDIGTNGSLTLGSAFIAIAAASYQPLGLTTAILPTITIVLLAIAVAMLALVYMGIRKQAKK